MAYERASLPMASPAPISLLIMQAICIKNPSALTPDNLLFAPSKVLLHVRPLESKEGEDDDHQHVSHAGAVR